MRYQNLISFQKHLAQAAPDHFSKVYLLMIPDDYERLKLLRSISLKISQKSPSKVFSFENSSLGEILDAFSPFLFEKEPVYILDEIEKMGKKEGEIFQKNLDLSATVLLGSRGKTALSSFVEDHGVIFDLLGEKPWEKQKRIASEVERTAAKNSKKFSPEALQDFLERMGTDLALIDQEMEKLFCFLGERSLIEKTDISHISSGMQPLSLWQTAEKIVWKEGIVFQINDLSVHALIPILRSQLEMGLKIASLMKHKAQEDLWKKALPKVWPKTLEKRKLFVQQKGISYFEKGLRLLYEIEMISRTGSLHLDQLFDLFRVKLSKI